MTVSTETTERCVECKRLTQYCGCSSTEYNGVGCTSRCVSHQRYCIGGNWEHNMPHGHRGPSCKWASSEALQPGQPAGDCPHVATITALTEALTEVLDDAEGLSSTVYLQARAALANAEA